MRGRKIISLILTIATLIFIIACLMFYNANQTYKAEKEIEKAIKAYSASMGEEEIKILTKEVNETMEKKLNEMNTNELSQKDLEELLEAVMKELETRTLAYRDTDITQEELNNIANEVIRKIIELKLGPATEEELVKLEAYKNQLDQISRMQQGFDSKITAAENRVGELHKELAQYREMVQKELIQYRETFQKELVQHGEELQKGMAQHGGEFEKKLTQYREELQKGILQHGEELQKELLQYKEELQKELTQLKSDLQTRIGSLEKQMDKLDGNILYYEYDEASGTLKLMGQKTE